MFFIIVVNYFLSSTVYAAIYIDGPCPNVKPVDYFNKTAFVRGSWYEIGRYQNDFESRGDCITTNYLMDNENTKINFTQSEVLDGKLKTNKGFLDYAPNAGKSGILNIYSHDIDAALHTSLLPVYIMLIDYDKYGIGFECKYDEEKQKGHVYAWVISKTKKLEGEAWTTVEKFISSSPLLDMKNFIWEHFDKEACKINN